MDLCSLFITLLLLFFLNVFITAAVSNNPAKIITRLSIDCGSAATSAALNGREWIGDVLPEVSSTIRIKGSSTASTVTHSSISADQVPHKTARISPSQFSYAFRVSPGEKILRLHFNPAPYKGFKRFNDLFDVEAGPFILLSNFSASLTADALGVNTFSKEFCISVEENHTLSLTFSPVSSQSVYITYAFINGIEIIPVPLHLSYFKGGDHRAQLIGQKSLVYIDNSTALELTHRVNMKRDSVSMSDEFDGMLGMWGAFQKPEDNEINSITWKTPVDVGFRYLVRIHFCDLQLHAEETRGVSFKVLINDMIVDSSSFQERDERGILPYRDYVVAVKGRKQEAKRDLLMSLQSHDEFVNGLTIKGFEVFKLSNPDNSLSSPNAFPPQRDSPSWIIQNLLPILCNRNATATLTISILTLINIIVHMLRESCEASVAEEENRPSARAERLCQRFSLSEMKSATKNFSEALFIGRGGFGKVYKGLIDNGRETVAIKRLKSNSKQGRHEFLTEIETLCELRHINLVSLIGYCSDHKEMILVYEYMPSGTLADHLHKYARKGNDSCSLTWKQRLHICIGTARGLDYLHTGHGVIHRDVKASNILLDENFVAKVSDFGLAKPENRSNLRSHVSTKVKGTYGYLDPHYFSTRKLTRKSDTYAFGVVLLEVLCERQAMDPRFGEDEYCLTRWARNKINEGEVNQVVANSLMEEILPDSLKVFVEVAVRCLHDEPKKRPTMGQVVVQLESALELQESTKIVEPNHIAFVANDVCPSKEDMTPSANTEQPAEASTDVHADASLPEQTNVNWREPKQYKAFRFGAWDAFWNRLKPSKKKEPNLISDFSVESLQYDFARLRAATDDFSYANKLGQGGFGSVYKGKFLNGQEIAVKRLSTSSLQGNVEFKNEVLLLARVQHKNLVRLLGFCLEGNEMLLVYEFVENSSLDRFIFDPVKRSYLGWDQLYKIIQGTAMGLLYLHEGSLLRIVHRDLKASNVLLDGDLDPKISDFGMARILGGDETQLSTRCVVGTYGYMAPEYAMSGIFSVKSDIFSFGVLVLEILSGKKKMSFRNGEEVEDLLSAAWKNWKKGTAANMIDPMLRASTGSLQDMLRCIHIGLLCVQQNPASRPTMASIALMLSTSTITLPIPSKPAFFMDSRDVSEVFVSQEYRSTYTNYRQAEAATSQNDVTVTELSPR